MFYKNIGNFPKTFHGITFNPGDIKESPHYINDISMIITEKPKEQTAPITKPSKSSSKQDTKASKEAKVDAPEDNSKGGNDNGTDHD